MDRYCRICRNTSCSNHGKDITFLGEGWKCNYIPVPTNADRIRAMSDEEIAELILDWVQTGACNDFGIPVTGNCNGKCVECIVEWLKQPAEEVNNG